MLRTESLKIPISAGGLSVMATGVDLKNSLCRVQGDTAQLSLVSGDINDPTNYKQVADILNHTGGIDAVACDLHPDLHSTRLATQLAARLDIPLIQVQHHHAHIAAVVAEHGIEEPVVGVAMDGFGFGTDGSAWGGECLYVDGSSSLRLGSLKPVPMPGGDAASRQPWRMAVAWLDGHASLPELFKGLPVEAIQSLCDSSMTPMTTSAGRLFDAASAIVLGSREVSFEGEAAIALEKAAADVESFRELPYRINEIDGLYQLDCTEALAELAEAVQAGEPKPELAAGFHRMLAAGMAGMAIGVAIARKAQTVVLAGGCFLNTLLKEQMIASLERAGLKVLISMKLPQGDGAIALGQAWVAVQKMKRGNI
ncbi:MAG TPA: carbamoyltransferase HypF [Mariprofundaceae bacterium]|nr:carbamoyltransferase HypF [Mariprofundaceae bacterium]